MRRGGQGVQEKVTVVEHIYIYTHIQTSSIFSILHLFVECCNRFQHYTQLASWKRVNMSIAYMKHNAHQKHLKVCLGTGKCFNWIAKHLKVFYHWTESKPNNIQVILAFESALPLD